MTNWPKPATSKHLQQFLGFTDFDRCVVQGRGKGRVEHGPSRNPNTGIAEAETGRQGRTVANRRTKKQNNREINAGFPAPGKADNLATREHGRQVYKGSAIGADHRHILLATNTGRHWKKPKPLDLAGGT